jgi:hypothetical protein
MMQITFRAPVSFLSAAIVTASLTFASRLTAADITLTGSVQIGGKPVSGSV